MESWVPDLLLSFNLLADIPLVGNTLDFQNILFVFFFGPFYKQNISFFGKSYWNCRQEVHCGVVINWKKKATNVQQSRKCG